MRERAAVSDKGTLDVNTVGLCALICCNSHDGVSDDSRNN
jgi:hypothetical protein